MEVNLANKTNLIIFMTTFLLLSCGGGKKDALDDGKLTGDLYEHKYFKMNIELPFEWSIPDQKFNDQIIKEGEQALSKKGICSKYSYSLIERETKILFSLFEAPIGSSAGFNSYLMCVAENITSPTKLDSVDKYYVEGKKVLSSLGGLFRFEEPEFTQKIANKEFKCLPVTVALTPDHEVYIEYYTTIIKDYALVFAITYATNQQKQNLLKILDTLDFEK